jgi:hypothetical protein
MRRGGAPAHTTNRACASAAATQAKRTSVQMRLKAYRLSGRHAHAHRKRSQLQHHPDASRDHRRLMGPIATKWTNMNRTVNISRLPSTHEAAEDDNPKFTKRVIVGLATTVLVSGGLGLAGLGAGTAYAEPGFIDPVGPYHWCPGGKPLDVNWDQSICHTYWHVATGAGNVGGPGDSHNNLWEGPNPPRVPEGPCFSMWIPSPCPAG